MFVLASLRWLGGRWSASAVSGMALVGWVMSLSIGLAVPGIVQASDLPAVSVERASLPRLFQLDGTVEAVKRTTVSAQIAGQVAEVLVDVDDFVEQGQVLVRLDDAQPRAALAEAQAGLNSAQAALVDARSDFHRTQDLFGKKLVARSKLDKATRALKSAQAARKAAQAALDRAAEQLQYTEVRAPYTGIVTERHHEVGEVVQPGQRLMSGISLEQLRVVVDVPQSVIFAVRARKQASVLLADGQWKPVQSMTIFPVAQAGSSAFKVRLDLPQGDLGLFPGMSVKTAFVIGQSDVLVVPAAAVVFRSEVVGAYVLADDGRLRFRRIRVGELRGERFAVLSGLLEGEQVVTDPIAAGIALKAQLAVSQEQGDE